MASVNPKMAHSGLSRRLVSDGLISEKIVLEAQLKANKEKKPLVRYLVSNNLIDPRLAAISASQEFGLPLLDIKVLDLSTAPITLVEERLIRQHNALPLFKRGNRLYIGVSDPTNLQALDEIKFHTGLNALAILVEENRLQTAIDNALEQHDSSMDDLGDDLDDIDLGSEDGETKEDDAESNIDDTPVVRYINKVLLEAIRRGASDVHFEPYEKLFRVRFRQDGILKEFGHPPLGLATRLVSRLKVMSRMDIAERRVPQDGRIKLKISKNKSIDFRVNTCPTLFGEKVVLRILDPTSAEIGIEALGFEPIQQKHFMDALTKPYGMILVTGPTGSGKTVSLYTGLNLLNTVDRNISTAEDPVEINVTGINQVNVNNKAGMTFPVALRAFLRQDPDIIMVGEIRDLETAEISIKAAQTGHLVLSTLHTNDATQTLTRLTNMGIPSYNIASSVLLIMAQRLARRLCKHCKKRADLPKSILIETGFREEDFPIEVYEPIGCDQCANGYKGRVGIYQVLPMTEDMERLILDSAGPLELAKQALNEGIDDLRLSGLKKVAAGLISIEELNRVTKD